VPVTIQAVARESQIVTGLDRTTVRLTLEVRSSAVVDLQP
jgi:hypothetical protein